MHCTFHSFCPSAQGSICKRPEVHTLDSGARNSERPDPSLWYYESLNPLNYLAKEPCAHTHASTKDSVIPAPGFGSTSCGLPLAHCFANSKSRISPHRVRSAVARRSAACQKFLHDKLSNDFSRARA